jgi:hypothetical protein
MNAFSRWLNTFLQEKKIDLDSPIDVTDREGTPHWMTVGVIVEALHNANDREQAAVKNTLVKIDFLNGNVYPFFAYLAVCMANTRLDQMEAA